MRLVTDDTVLADITAITDTRIALGCGHDQTIPPDLPSWLAERIARLYVGALVVCVDCVQEEILRAQAD